MPRKRWIYWLCACALPDGHWRDNISFDLFLIPFKDGTKSVADVDAARQVLECFRFEHDEKFNSYSVSFDDGSHLEMNAGSLHCGAEPFDGGSIELRGLSDEIGRFVFEFARAAGCVVFPAMKEACVLLPRDDLHVHLPADIPQKFKVVPVSSGAEVLAALSGGYEAWAAYRNRVLRTAGAEPPRGGAG